MLDLLKGLPEIDQPLPISKVPATLEKLGFKRPHISTVYRMIHQERLKTFRAFGHRYTTIRAVAESAEDSQQVANADLIESNDAAEFLAAEGM